MAEIPKKGEGYGRNSFWEGFWGGALACVVSSFFLIPYHPTFPVWTFPTLAGITAVAATVGDLIQSKFKSKLFHMTILTIQI